MKFSIFFSVFVISTFLYACNSNNSFSNNTTEETPVGSAEMPKSVIKGQVIFEQNVQPAMVATERQVLVMPPILKQVNWMACQ